MIKNSPNPKTVLQKLIWYCLNQKLLVSLAVVLAIGWGLSVSPFEWQRLPIPRNPVPVDAIPDIGDNQQIVFTSWPGRSPQDVEDQITTPLTVALLGVPEVKTVRSFSMFGFSSIYVIFKEDADFYWSRTRILEKLNSLGPGSLPNGVRPTLGPDATALGQVFWYTLEGRDDNGNLTGGWDLDELRSVQDYQVRYALQAAEGVSEVASIGGHVKEYQIDVDPFKARQYGVTLEDIMMAVKMANRDIGAKSIEVNRVEYIIRGIGFIKTLDDIESSVIKATGNVPVTVGHVANVSVGPALRRGVLDKQGAEAVGGVVVARFGENPLKVITNVKDKISEIAPGLPKKTLADGSASQITVVPFYDRSGIIRETLNTLSKALIDEVLITIIVVLLMVRHFLSALLISGVLPLAILMVFIAMKYFGVDANIVALSGIAIAIGTIVDMGIVMIENILKRLESADPGIPRKTVVYNAAKEVGPAILTAIATTVISFLPVFTMIGAEGKLFKPLAWTKTYALLASVAVALFILPPLANLMLRRARGIRSNIEDIPRSYWRSRPFFINLAIVLCGAILLSIHWSPLGREAGYFLNGLFVMVSICTILGGLGLFQHYYSRILRWCLDNKGKFMVIPLVMVLAGLLVWKSLGKEFMPALNEGSFLYMPVTMTHAAIGEVTDVLQKQDMAFSQIPEIESVVGKLGRVDSALDPAPLSMIETVINYSPEYLLDESGRKSTFKVKRFKKDLMRKPDGTPILAPDGKPYYVRGRFERDENGALIPSKFGKPFRLWRYPLTPKLNPDRDPWKGVKTPEDIWNEIQKAAQIPGVTTAPRLQPIEARLVMLQSGVRAPMALKIKGPDLATIEAFGFEVEKAIKEVPSVEAQAVFADRIIGKPYLEIHINRQAIARYGIMLEKVQNAIEMAVGGKMISMTVEGRERYPIRIRYMRELRDNFDLIGDVRVDGPNGIQIPLKQLAQIKYVQGPQVIRSEDTFLTSYVLFDKHSGAAGIAVIADVRDHLNAKIQSGELSIPSGVSFSFTGNYENLVRSEKTLQIVLPLALVLIFMILYLQFKSIRTTGIAFSGILLAWAGGFILVGLYGQSWFMSFPFIGDSLRSLFQIQPINLSVAVWVGFLALFGIASDNGVILGTYLDQSFEEKKPETVTQIRQAAVEAGERRVRPCVMTTATTLLALLPVLTSTGRGSDIMVPMAIPVFGGMLGAVLSILMVPVLYCWVKERSSL